MASYVIAHDAGMWFHRGRRPVRIVDAPNIVLALQDEIRRSEESRYDHRLYGMLLVAQGMTCLELGRLLGNAPRSIESWLQRFESHGLAGLARGGTFRTTSATG